MAEASAPSDPIHGIPRPPRRPLRRPTTSRAATAAASAQEPRYNHDPPCHRAVTRDIMRVLGGFSDMLLHGDIAFRDNGFLRRNTSGRREVSNRLRAASQDFDRVIRDDLALLAHKLRVWCSRTGFDTMPIGCGVITIRIAYRLLNMLFYEPARITLFIDADYCLKPLNAWDPSAECVRFLAELRKWMKTTGVYSCEGEDAKDSVLTDAEAQAARMPADGNAPTVQMSVNAEASAVTTPANAEAHALPVPSKPKQSQRKKRRNMAPEALLNSQESPDASNTRVSSNTCSGTSFSTSPSKAPSARQSPTAAPKKEEVESVQQRILRFLAEVADDLICGALRLEEETGLLCAVYGSERAWTRKRTVLTELLFHSKCTGPEFRRELQQELLRFREQVDAHASINYTWGVQAWYTEALLRALDPATYAEEAQQDMDELFRCHRFPPGGRLPYPAGGVSPEAPYPNLFPPVEERRCACLPEGVMHASLRADSKRDPHVVSLPMLYVLSPMRCMSPERAQLFNLCQFHGWLQARPEVLECVYRGGITDASIERMQSSTTLLQHILAAATAMVSVGWCRQHHRDIRLDPYHLVVYMECPAQVDFANSVMGDVCEAAGGDSHEPGTRALIRRAARLLWRAEYDAFGGWVEPGITDDVCAFNPGRLYILWLLSRHGHISAAYREDAVLQAALADHPIRLYARGEAFEETPVEARVRQGEAEKEEEDRVSSRDAQGGLTREQPALLNSTGDVSFSTDTLNDITTAATATATATVTTPHETKANAPDEQKHMNTHTTATTASSASMPPPAPRFVMRDIEDLVMQVPELASLWLPRGASMEKMLAAVVDTKTPRVTIGALVRSAAIFVAPGGMLAPSERNPSDIDSALEVFLDVAWEGGLSTIGPHDMQRTPFGVAVRQGFARLLRGGDERHAMRNFTTCLQLARISMDEHLVYDMLPWHCLSARFVGRPTRFFLGLPHLPELRPEITAYTFVRLWAMIHVATCMDHIHVVPFRGHAQSTFITQFLESMSGATRNAPPPTVVQPGAAAEASLDGLQSLSGDVHVQRLIEAVTREVGYTPRIPRAGILRSRGGPDTITTEFVGTAGRQSAASDAVVAMSDVEGSPGAMSVTNNTRGNHPGSESAAAGFATSEQAVRNRPVPSEGMLHFSHLMNRPVSSVPSAGAAAVDASVTVTTVPETPVMRDDDVPAVGGEDVAMSHAVETRATPASPQPALALPAQTGTEEKDALSGPQPQASDRTDPLLCRVCWVRPRELVFIPCGHFCICRECLSEVYRKSPNKSCVMCRQPATHVLRAFQ